MSNSFDPDLGPNCFQRLSAEDTTSRQTVNTSIYILGLSASQYIFQNIFFFVNNEGAHQHVHLLGLISTSVIHSVEVGLLYHR